MHSGSPGSFCRRLPLFCFHTSFYSSQLCTWRAIRREGDTPRSGNRLKWTSPKWKNDGFLQKKRPLDFQYFTFFGYFLVGWKFNSHPVKVQYWQGESSTVSCQKFNFCKVSIQYPEKGATYCWDFYERNTLNGIFLACISKKDNRKSFKNQSVFVKYFVLKSWFFKLKWRCLVKIG